MSAVAELESLRQKFKIETDDLDRIVACEAKTLRERAEIFARWSELQEQKCREETAEPTIWPWWK